MAAISVLISLLSASFSTILQDEPKNSVQSNDFFRNYASFHAFLLSRAIFLPPRIADIRVECVETLDALYVAHHTDCDRKDYNLVECLEACLRHD